MTKRKEKFLPTDERGFSLIELMIVLAIIGILIGVSVTGYRAVQMAGNEAAALQQIQNLAKAERTYFLRKGEFGNFDQLNSSGAIDDKRFAGDSSTVSSYVYTLKITPKSRNQAPTFTINADPQQGSLLAPSGEKHFYVDSGSDTVKVNTKQPATPDDPPAGS
jgi:type IV pilus assembly protein PilE